MAIWERNVCIFTTKHKIANLTLLQTNYPGTRLPNVIAFGLKVTILYNIFTVTQYDKVCEKCSFVPRWVHLQHIIVCSVYITKTCPYNFDPLKPHFYIIKLEFTGVYIIFLISAQNICCGYSLEPPRRRHEKYQSFLSDFSFSFWRWNFQYIWIGVFS